MRIQCGFQLVRQRRSLHGLDNPNFNKIRGHVVRLREAYLGALNICQLRPIPRAHLESIIE